MGLGRELEQKGGPEKMVQWVTCMSTKMRPESRSGPTEKLGEVASICNLMLLPQARRKESPEGQKGLA